MLEFLRRGVKTWVAKVLLGLLIASFAVWGISDVFSTRLDSTVATVGDAEITFEEFADALQRQRRAISRQQGRGVSYAEMREAGVDRGLIARMVRDKAFEEELARLGIAAPDGAVADAIRQNENFAGSGGEFSESAYRLTLSRLGFTPAEFEALTRTVLGQQLLEDAAMGAAEAPPGMAPRIAAWQGEERGALSLRIGPQTVEDPGTPSDEALATFYDGNRQDYRIPERRSGVYLHVDVDALAAEAEPTAEEVEAWYEENADRFSEPAARVIDQLPLGQGDAEATAAPVLQGEIPLEALAAQLGEDPTDLAIGRVERGDLPEAVGEAVFAATEPGIVGPVEAPSGPVLVRVREVIEGGAPPLEEVRGRIAERIARERALDRAPSIASEIDELRAAGRPLREIAEEAGLEVRRFEGLSREGRLADGSEAEGLPGREPFLAEVFEALDYEERDLVQLPDGGYFVVLVEEIAESRVPELAEVREAVVEDWRAAEREAAALAEAQAIAAEVAPGRSLADIAADRGLETTEHPAFPRQVPPEAFSRELAGDVFGVPEGRAVAGPAAEGGALAVAVTSVSPPGPDAMEAMTGRIERVLADSVGSDDMEYFARAITSRYESTVDESVVDAAFQRLAGGGA